MKTEKSYVNPTPCEENGINDVENDATPAPCEGKGIDNAGNAASPTPCGENGENNTENDATPTPCEGKGIDNAGNAASPTLCGENGENNTENEASSPLCVANGMDNAENAASPNPCVEKCEFSSEDIAFMRRAMELAREAESRDEVPVGAVIVRDGKIIAEGFNTRESDRCAVCHAEINAIIAACRALGGWRLPETTLYVTMEPCAMCAGAIMNARIPKVVYGAPDLRFGAMGSLFDLSEMAVNHRPTVLRGVLGKECADVLTSYFRRKRG